MGSLKLARTLGTPLNVTQGPLPQDLGQSQDVEQGAEVEVEGLEGREVEEVEAQLPVGHQLGCSS